jgi:hypothetical protein
MKGKAMTIPELKQAFDALERETHTLLKEKNTAQHVRKFQGIWKSIFHRPVSAKAAESYLQIKRSSSSSSSSGKTRKQKQHGGAAALAGAPLDYMTRPGVDGVHGSFPAYQAQGLSFYNTINKDGLFQDCGVKDITPVVPVSIGSNQVGGTFSDLSHATMYKPIHSSVPATPLQDAQTYFQGRPLGASPAPESSALKV